MSARGFYDPEELTAFVERFRVRPGCALDLARDFDPRFTCCFEGRRDSAAILDEGTELLAGLQDRMWAQAEDALLVVLQARDAAGKDSTIKHVMTGVNPQGVDVRSFSVPNLTELKHDFLWRHMRSVPERGRIMIHNRSHYEEVLVVRVHPELLALRGIDPAAAHDKRFWEHRFEDIRSWEHYLANNRIHSVKLFLNVSKGKQLKRLMERIERPDKHWKFDLDDIRERGFWDEYERAHEQAIAATATDESPWYVVPADHKWFTRLAVTGILIHALRRIAPAYPAPSTRQPADLAEGRRLLEANGDVPSSETES